MSEQGLKLKLDASPISSDDGDVQTGDWLDEEEKVQVVAGTTVRDLPTCVHEWRSQLGGHCRAALSVLYRRVAPCAIAPSENLIHRPV